MNKTFSFGSAFHEDNRFFIEANEKVLSFSGQTVLPISLFDAVQFENLFPYMLTQDRYFLHALIYKIIYCQI